MSNVDQPSIPIISCAEAKALGLSRYFTGKPCKRGHVAERTVKRGQCIACKQTLDRERYASDPEPAKVRARARSVSHKDSIKEYNAARYAANPEFWIKGKKQWRAKNIEHVRLKGRQYAANRLARKLKASGSYTITDVLELLSLQKNKCVYCRSRLDVYEVDHIMPLSLGGSNSRDNLQILCPSCNRSKHAKHPVEFAQKRGMLL